MRSMFQIVIGAAALVLAAPTLAQDPAGVAALAWMEGNWQSEVDGRWTEERWTDARGGMLMGVSRSGRADRVDSFEYMRIAADEAGRISFHGSPSGKPAVAFASVSSGAGEAVFENPTHDFPTRISYLREGDMLTATVSGKNGEGAMTWRYRRVAD